MPRNFRMVRVAESAQANAKNIDQHFPPLGNQTRKNADKRSEKNAQSDDKSRQMIIVVFLSKNNHRQIKFHKGAEASGFAALPLKMQDARSRVIVIVEPQLFYPQANVQILAVHKVVFVKAA